MSNIYCLDTSVFVGSRWKYYRPKSFPTFWSKLKGGIETGMFISPTLVLEELKKKDDDIYSWASSLNSFFIPLDNELQIAQEAIINQFPRLINQAKNRSLCDPWVIALAQLRNCPVVTDESIGGLRNPRIPDVCHELGIKSLTIADLIEELEWKF